MLSIQGLIIMFMFGILMTHVYLAIKEWLNTYFYIKKSERYWL